jgi:hypothetical protein
MTSDTHLADVEPSIPDLVLRVERLDRAVARPQKAAS